VSQRATRRPAILLSAFVAAACVGISDTGPPSVWETQLKPEFGYPDLTGQVAVVSQINGSQVGIGVSGATSGTTLTWAIRQGTCEAPGLQLGPDTDYPELEIDLSGHATAESHIAARLQLNHAYHAELRSAADASRVACGDLQSD